MNWLVYAVIAQFIWAIIAHIDKNILGKLYKDEVGAAILFSCLFGIVILPVIYLFHPEILQSTNEQAIYGAIAGALYMFSIIFYFYALRNTEATLISILWLMSGPMGYALGYFFFGEILSPLELFGGVLILMSGILAVLKRVDQKFKFDTKVFLLMLGATILFSFSGIAFKNASTDDFWNTFFFELVGSAIVGVFLFIFIKSYRRNFVEIIQDKTFQVLTISSFNELIQVFANLSFRLALTLGPISLVYILSSINPIFVFLIGVFLTIFFPKLASEDLTKSSVLLKVLAITLAIIGITFLEI